MNKEQVLVELQALYDTVENTGFGGEDEEYYNEAFKDGLKRAMYIIRTEYT